jgi:hypothetical protein
LTFAEEDQSLQGDSYFTMAPQDFIAQEADGTKVAINDYDSQTPWTSKACNANSVGTTPILSASPTHGGLPVINAACAVVTSYLRSQPTRILYPTEIFRLQSSSIKSLSMNGDFRYTQANMNLPDYYDSVSGPEWNHEDADLHRRRPSAPRRRRRRLRRRLAGEQDIQPLRAGRLFQRAPAGLFHHHQFHHALYPRHRRQ